MGESGNEGPWRVSSPRSEAEGAVGVRRLKHRTGIALLAAALVFLLTTAIALAVTGDLTQPAGTAGCVSENGTGPCAYGHALSDAFGVAVSPDGKSVYVASANSDAVVRLNRNTTTGAITQPAGAAGCVSNDGTGPCATGFVGSPFGVAVSPDGKSVYLASYPWYVVRFNRNTTTGALTQPAGPAACVSVSAADGCTLGYGLEGAFDVKVSPDGKSVYVAAVSSDRVVRFNRNTTTGAITQPTGGAGAISGNALDAPIGVAVSPDGKSVYVASFLSDAVARFNRNTTNGALTQAPGTAGCVAEDPSFTPGCGDGHGLDGPHGVAVSADNKSVYAASFDGDALVRFNRNTTNGAITQPAGTAGCVSETGSGPCANGRALDSPSGVTMSPGGKSVYVSSFDSLAVARFNRAP
jgi:DNA-binding beta-propeller fold protein YncE